MKGILAAALLGAIAAMLAITVRASLERGVLAAASEIAADPWGLATLADAYFAFLAVWLVVAAREPSPVARVGWLAAFLLLGTFAIATYFLVSLRRLPRGAGWRDAILGPRGGPAAEKGSP